MMTKADHIAYWIDLAERDWGVVQDLFAPRRYVHWLFFAHLTIEKLSKALWVKHNVADIPPRSHNIIRLLADTPVTLTSVETQLRVLLNNFQLEGRYPGDTQVLYQQANATFTHQTLSDTDTFRQCLRKLLP